MIGQVISIRNRLVFPVPAANGPFIDETDSAFIIYLHLEVRTGFLIILCIHIGRTAMPDINPFVRIKMKFRVRRIPIFIFHMALVPVIVDRFLHDILLAVCSGNIYPFFSFRIEFSPLVSQTAAFAVFCNGAKRAGTGPDTHQVNIFIGLPFIISFRIYGQITVYPYMEPQICLKAPVPCPGIHMATVRGLFRNIFKTKIILTGSALYLFSGFIIPGKK